MNRILSIVFIQIFFLVFLQVAPLYASIDVFVSLPPLKSLSDQIGGKLVTTQILVGKGQDPHTFKPTPHQIVALSRAKILFTVGMPFEKRLVKQLKMISDHLNLIDVSKNVHKIHMGINIHHHGDLDPHIWLSPKNLKLMAANMAEAMIQVDPSNKQTYKQNLADMNRKLDKLHNTITKELAPYKGATVYVFHPAFGYFTHSYHLKQLPVEIEGKSPTPKQLASLILRAKASGIKVIFIQPQFDPKSAAAIADSIGAKLIRLNPLAEDVEANLQRISGKITEALGNQYKGSLTD